MGLTVKTQYRTNGQASHRYWKLVTFSLRAHLSLLLKHACTFTGFTLIMAILASQTFTCAGWP